MFRNISKATYLLIGIFLLFTVVVTKGCKEERNRITTPVSDEIVYLNFSKIAYPHAKVTGLTITVQDKISGGIVATKVIPNVQQLPVTTSLGWTGSTTNCEYEITVIANLSRGGTTSASETINACTGSNFTLEIGWYEPFTVRLVVTAKTKAQLNESVEVKCSWSGLNAPDIAAVPITVDFEGQTKELLTPEGGTLSVSAAQASGWRRFTCTMSDGRGTTVSESATVTWTSASMLKEYSPVKVFAAAQNVVSLTEIIGKIRKSGFDIEMLSTNHGFTIDFSQPVSFATLKLSGSSSEELLKAFNRSDTLVDMDAGSSELSVFGEGITRLVLVKGSNQVDELSFIPQL